VRYEGIDPLEKQAATDEFVRKSDWMNVLIALPDGPSLTKYLNQGGDISRLSLRLIQLKKNVFVKFKAFTPFYFKCEGGLKCYGENK
jgi:hypothetical protein